MFTNRLKMILALAAVACASLVGVAHASFFSGGPIHVKAAAATPSKSLTVTGLGPNKAKLTIKSKTGSQSIVVYGGDVRLALVESNVAP